MAQKIPLSNSTRFIYILHNESYYILRYLNCSPHLHVLPSSCEHKSFLILDKVASVTKVSSERIVTSSTMFLLLLLGSGLSLSNAVAGEPTTQNRSLLGAEQVLQKGWRRREQWGLSQQHPQHASHRVVSITRL